jgi:hypothetical protein
MCVSIESSQVIVVVEDGPAFPILKSKIALIEGFVSVGLLQGPIIIYLKNGIVVRSKVSDGVLHGLTYTSNVYTTLPLAKEYGIGDQYGSQTMGYIPHTGLIAHFRNGRPEGIAWQVLVGRGMLYGRLHHDTR